ncbi:hypothetical protein ET475_03485 [Microbacterium protaetiae]|uniref:DUF4097 domain-containing protein n=1 Tax=Microbacterium protaetiae TaxID=2509458 RepID=A0A4P6EC10_9MICO|nr:DUF4097 family beta strand repeat-containing protein [Microbacterium protaetiae]QAY59146.1 hypothetical protein ET475_03485 [Microbacterium protaetiae]
MSTTQSARTVAIVAIALGGVIAIGSVASAAASTIASASVQTSTRTIDVAGVDELNVDMNAGTLRVEFADVAEAELSVTGGTSADRWTLRRQGSGLRVGSPDGHFWWWGGWFGHGNGDAVLTLPQSLSGLDADLGLSAGATSAEGDFGDITVSSGAGRVRIDGTAQTISADISAGRADLALADVQRADLKLSAGDVDATFTGSQPQRMQLTASAGSMHVTVPEGQYDVNQRISAGTFDNRIGSTPGAASTVMVDVSAGTITLVSAR